MRIFYIPLDLFMTELLFSVEVVTSRDVLELIKVGFPINKIAYFLAYIEKFPYLCIIDAKQTKASIIFGLAMEKILISARVSSAWLSNENKE